MNNLLTLQQLFENRVFKIPNYQRGYSWEYQQRKDLIEDLESMKRNKHYTGTVVLKKNGELVGFGETYDRYDIVDGQQRLTTIVIFLLEIINELKLLETEEANEISINIQKRYINYNGPQGSIYKLELDEDNDNFFKQKVINSETAECKIKSHFRLIDAQINFHDYCIRKREEHREDYDQYLKDLINKLTQHLIFTLYEVEDDSEVGIIFEVMNSRGKPLSQLEKVKNYLIYQTDRISLDDLSKKQMIDLINYSWKEILENLSKAGKSRNEDENQFLRLNYIINFYSDISSYNDEEGKKISINSQLSNIHNLIKNRFKNMENDEKICYEEMRKYILSLKSMSLRFRDLVNPYDSFSFEEVDEKFIGDIKSVTSQLNRLEIQSNILVILLALYEKFSQQPSQLLDLMKLCEKFVFRIYYIAEYRLYSAQSKIYALANNVYNSNLTYYEIEKKLKEIIKEYCDEDEIEGNLIDPKYDYYDWNGLRYFLYEYERKRCEEETGKRPGFEWEDLKKMKKEDSIEHILPQTIKEESGKEIIYWISKFDLSTHSKNVKRLGNLTLSTRNSSLGNKGFDKKKEIYNISSWQIERDLAKFEEWTIEQINARETELVKFAKNRWKIEY